MTKIRPGGQKTAHRAVKWPPTKKPKLSRVTSGYGAYDPIESDPSDLKKLMFIRDGRPPSNRFDTNTLPVWCLVMMVTKYLDYVAKKIILGKKCIFGFYWAQKSDFFYATTIKLRLNRIITRHRMLLRCWLQRAPRGLCHYLLKNLCIAVFTR